MHWIAAHVTTLMRVGGLLTCSMLLALIAPQTALRLMFGAEMQHPLADIVVRNWGALIGGYGLLLVYASDKPALRKVALTIALVGKVLFVGLILVYGRPYLGHAMVAVAADVVIVALFLVCLLGSARK